MKINANPQITCRSVLNHICADDDVNTNTPLCVEIRKHLENCSGCTQYVHSLQATIESYKKYSPEIPDNLHQKVMEAFQRVGR